VINAKRQGYGFVVKIIVVFCVGDKLILVFALAGSITAIFYYLKAVIRSIDFPLFIKLEFLRHK
jgi:hypothetical protein